MSVFPVMVIEFLTIKLCSNPLEVIICGKCVVNFYHNISFIVLLYEPYSYAKNKIRNCSFYIRF